MLSAFPFLVSAIRQLLSSPTTLDVSDQRKRTRQSAPQAQLPVRQAPPPAQSPMLAGTTSAPAP